MDNILSLVNEYRILSGLIITTLILIVTIKLLWEKVSFFVLCMRYKFPLIGKRKRLAKDIDNSALKGGRKWMLSEEVLCQDFYEHYHAMDKDGEHFAKCQTYLEKVDEVGRNNLHFFGWILIAAIVFVEAMGFSYVLSGFTIPGASENVQQMGAIGIAFLVSVLLVAFTHYSGHELHYNQLIQKVRGGWKRSKKNGTTEDLESSDLVSLDRDSDDEQPRWKQMLNRLKHNDSVTPKYTITIGAIILIVLVAVGATYVRGQVLEQEASERHLGIEEGGSSASYSDPYAKSLPSILINESKKASEIAQEDADEAFMKGGWATFIVLAVIFVFIQLLGILIGYKTGFAGKESSGARKDIGPFKTRREFETYYHRKKQNIARVAQKNLSELQQGLAKRVAENGTDNEIAKVMKEVNSRNFLLFAEAAQDEEKFHHEKDEGRKLSSATLSTENSTSTSDSVEETQEEKEARVRRELLAEMEAQNQPKQETEEEMRQRILAEIKEQKGAVS